MYLRSVFLAAIHAKGAKDDAKGRKDFCSS